MTNAERILSCLDKKLNAPVDLTLYGRAALELGFEESLEEHALSRDVDAVFWIGQAEELNATTNFWTSVEEVNDELSEDGLYISHFFTEDQVILRPGWRSSRIPIGGDRLQLQLHRLGNEDLLLSKLMRDDPLDLRDAQFIVRASGLGIKEIRSLLEQARVPDAPEVKEQFAIASQKLLGSLVA